MDFSGLFHQLNISWPAVAVNIVGFWLVGVPISIYLGFRTDARAAGLWWGFVAGLGAVAAFLVLRIRVRMRDDLDRVERD